MWFGGPKVGFEDVGETGIILCLFVFFVFWFVGFEV